MTIVRLYQSGVITLDGSGNGTVKVGPLSAREVWHPENAHVSANQNPTKQAQCRVFVGDSVTQQNYRDGTINGSSGDSTDRINADVIKCGQYVWAVWTGGDANVTAVLTVTGTKEI